MEGAPVYGGSRGLSQEDQSAWKWADTEDSPSLNRKSLCVQNTYFFLPFDLFVRGFHPPVNFQ